MRIKTIYTDGSCPENPGPGGWAVVVEFDGDKVFERGGAERDDTTNNRMELQAAIEALKVVKLSKQTSSVDVITDSQYVKKGITEWIEKWKWKNWKTSSNKDVTNRDLWEILDKLNSETNIEWKHVRGHQGVEGNERCDEIAGAFSADEPIELKQL